MKQLFLLLFTTLCLVGCNTKYPEPDVPMENKSAYITITNKSDYTPFLILDGDALGMPVKKGNSQIDVLPIFCNKPGRFSVVYDMGEKLEYVIGQDIVFKNGMAYSLVIENYTCSFK